MTDTCISKKSPAVQYMLIVIPLLLVIGLAVAVGILASQITKTDDIAEEHNICSSKQCVQIAGAMLSGMDESVDPCQDFYQYTCGGFEQSQAMPAGYGRWGPFEEIDLWIEESLHNLLESPKPAVEAVARTKARDYYSSCMDFDRIASEGTAAMQKMASDMGGLLLKTDSTVGSDWDLESQLEKRNNYTTDGLFDFFVMPDVFNSSVNILWVAQDGLYKVLTQHDALRDSRAAGEPTYDEAAVDLYIRWAELIGESDIDRTVVEKVLALEKSLNDISVPIYRAKQFTREDENRVTVPLSTLQSRSPAIDWLRFFNSVFSSLPNPISITLEEEVYLSTATYLWKLSPVLTRYSMMKDGNVTLHNYLIFRAMLDYAPKMGGDFKKAYDDFRTAVYGTQGSQPSWQLCVADTDATVAFGLAAMYVDKYFPEAGKTQTQQLIWDVSAAFRERILQAEWMDAVTKQRALEKMDYMRNEVAYPYWLKDDKHLEKFYSLLSVDGSYVNNQFTRYRFNFINNLQPLRSPADPDRWEMSPAMVNAYYMPSMNKFVILAGILQSPFFQLGTNIPPVLNYGAIGIVIGHEIGHGFDNSGSLFDKYGNLAFWWSNETYRVFNEKSQCMIDQYSEYTIMGHQNDGEKTLGENIADNGGMGASYLAYKGYNGQNKKQTLIGLENLTADQLFFVSFGQMWCTKYTEKTLLSLLARDVHSPGPIRVIGSVQNSPEFAQAFKCKSGSPMNPVDKCRVW